MGSLQQRLMDKQEGSFFYAQGVHDISLIVKVLSEIVASMEYLHSRALVHSDLYDANVLFMSSGSSRRFTTKVGDFGCARILEEDSRRTDSMGCTSHMPPELF